MKRQTRNFSNKPVINFLKRKPEEEFLRDCEDSALLETITDYMKGRLEIEDVMNDPGRADAELMTAQVVSDFSRNKVKNSDNEKFIRDAFREIPDENLLDEISHISREIKSSGVNDITAEWVKEWHENRQKKGSGHAQREEIRDFITSSLVPEEIEMVPESASERKRGARALYIRYATLSAAASLGTFLLIKTLVPGSDPDRIFSKYYEPFDAVSPVTRSISENTRKITASAIEFYKASDYLAAEAELKAAIKNDPSDMESRFYLGLAEVEIGNYDKAINILTEVSANPGQYSKEAKWYLGLSYLRTGENKKAADCFTYLADHKGYYSKRSEKILRRLK
jgi:TolA-binding protein